MIRPDYERSGSSAGQLRLTPSFPFVGRPREMAALRSLMPMAAGEGRRIALVGGEAGSGKSRLVREFANVAAQDGALVLYGACDSVVSAPYQPIAEAVPSSSCERPTRRSCETISAPAAGS